MAPDLPCSAISSARALENDDSAASALLNSPASDDQHAGQDQQPDVDGAHGPVLGRSGVDLVAGQHLALAGALPLGEQPGLEAEHLAVLLGLGVVVAEQVQDPVHGQQVDLVGGGVVGLAGLAGLLGLPLGDRVAQHQVAEHALLGLLADQAGAQLVHREGQHVGRARPCPSTGR